MERAESRLETIVGHLYLTLLRNSNSCRRNSNWSF